MRVFWSSKGISGGRGIGEMERYRLEVDQYRGKVEDLEGMEFEIDPISVVIKDGYVYVVSKRRVEGEEDDG